MVDFVNNVRSFVNCAIFCKLCDRMRFEVGCAKSHHRVISEGLHMDHGHCLDTYNKSLKVYSSYKNKSGNNKHLMTGPEGNSEFCFPRISMFPETKLRETLRFEGNKIHCSSRDQSLSVYCLLPLELIQLQ